MQTGIIFGQMLVLLVMMVIGYYVYKKEWIDKKAAKQLSGLVVNVFNPVLVLNGVIGQNAGGSGEKLMLNLGLVFLYFAVLILFSFLMPVLLRTEKKLKTTVRLMTVFANVGFMGIPVVQSIYGEEAIIYVAFYILVYNLLLYTYGIRMAEKSALEYRGVEASGSWKENLKRMWNPGVIAALLAVVVFAADLSVPGPVETFCGYMGNATVPLSMILIGISLAQEDLKKIFADIRIYLFILLRMIALPVIMVLLLKPLIPDPVILGVFVLEIGMPVGSVAAMLIQEKGGDDQYCTKGIVMSTLCSILTIPIISIFL